MIRLTVLYNLAEGQNEAEFLEWRLSEHQQNNAAIPGVINTDFAQITGSWPSGTSPRFRFQTTVDWPDRQSYEAGFLRGDVQEKLLKDVKKLGEHEFIVAEILT